MGGIGVDARKCEIGRETEKKLQRKKGEWEMGDGSREGMYDTANSKIVKIERILMQ